MECPKCKSRNICFTRVNRTVNQKGVVRSLKRYFCLDCNCDFDFSNR